MIQGYDINKRLLAFRGEFTKNELQPLSFICMRCLRFSSLFNKGAQIEKRCTHTQIISTEHNLLSTIAHYAGQFWVLACGECSRLLWSCILYWDPTASLQHGDSSTWIRWFVNATQGFAQKYQMLKRHNCSVNLPSSEFNSFKKTKTVCTPPANLSLCVARLFLWGRKKVFLPLVVLITVIGGFSGNNINKLYVTQT